MMLLGLRGGYMYEHRPDVFPEGYLTELEISLWARYFDEKGAGKR